MSTIAETPPAPTTVRAVNTRAFLAGGTATTALIAGAIILFASLATYVAFNASGGGEEADSTATVPAGRFAGAPEAAANSAGRAPADVAATPAAPTAVAPPPAPVVIASTQTVPPSKRVPTETVGVTPADPPPHVPAGTPAQQTGALGGTVGGLENATGNLGLDAPLGDLTRPITGPLDETLNDTLNNVGGLLGNPDLGDQVTSGLNQTTNALLGQGGLVDGLLNGGR
jgi:hypothetical protein